MSQSVDAADEEIRTVIDAFRDQRGPFAEARFPEQAVLDSAPESDHLAILSYGASLDYNRDATRMWENIGELYERHPEWFTPSNAAEADLDTMKAVFEDIGIRYYNRDAAAWQDNSKTVADTFGSWERLLEAADYDAPSLVSNLREHDIKYLQGTKIAPFYVTIVHDFAHSLDRVWEVDVPVDVHVRKLSSALFDGEYSATDAYTRGESHDPMDDDDIRRRWSQFGNQSDVTPWSIDGALWLIGANWDDWGEEFWTSTVQ